MRLPGPPLGAILMALTLCCGQALHAQQLPDLALDSFPAVSRQAIAPALAEARTHPTDGSRVGRLGMVLQAWEQFDTAAALYARARALDPRFEWFYLGGIVAARLAHHDEAARLLAEAVRLAPTSIPARLALADGLFEKGDVDGAARVYSELTDGPGAPHAHYGLGRSLARNGENERAVRELETAVRLFPEFGAAWYSQGMVLRALGRLDEARTALARAQQLGAAWPAVDDPVLAGVRALRDDAVPHAQRGLALQNQGNTAGAIAEYEAALSSNPQLAAVHVNLIALYGRLRDWPRAEEHYREALRLGSVLSEAHFNYGICLGAQGKTTDAADAFRKALEVNSQYAAAWNGLAQLAEADGRVEEAETSYRKAAELAPDDPVLRFNVGRMLIAERRYEEAVAALEPLKTAQHEQRARFLFGLATASVLAGRVEDGKRYAIEARDLARASGQAALAAAIDGDIAKLPR